VHNRDSIIKVIGDKEYSDILDVLQDMRQQEQKKGRFMAVEGDIDQRGPEKKDLELHPGYRI
jgi:hypothetical protein